MKYTPGLEVILKELNLSIPSFRMIYCTVLAAFFRIAIPKMVHGRGSATNGAIPSSCIHISVQCRPLKGKVIKLCSSNIHNTIPEIPKMSQEGQLKCSHYNSGYCKFAKKERGCRFFHPEATCELPNCRNRNCPDRHPRSCKFGDTCIFQIRCSYKHEKEKAPEKSTSIEETVKELDQLKVDI